MSYINDLVGLLYWCGVNRLTCMCLIHVITEGCRATRRGKILLYLKKKGWAICSPNKKFKHMAIRSISPPLWGPDPTPPQFNKHAETSIFFYIWVWRMSIPSSAQLPTAFSCHRTVFSRIQEEPTASCGIWAHDLPLTKRVLYQLS